MKCEFIQNQSQLLFKKIIKIEHPNSHILETAKAITFLGTGEIIKQWRNILQQFQNAISNIIQRDIKNNNILFCEKTFLNKHSNYYNDSFLSKELQQLLKNCLIYVKDGFIRDRSKSNQTIRSLKRNDIDHCQTTTKIGQLLKTQKEEITKMLETKPSLKVKFLEERINRNVQQLKENIKKTNRTSYFISPKRLEQIYSKSLEK